MQDKTALRDAATIILLRDRASNPTVLMGQRGAAAAFMPNKVVFPGGAVDRGDSAVKLAAPLPQQSEDRLNQLSQISAGTLATAAIRELWEETGQRLSRPGHWADTPADWHSFANTGHVPDPSALHFFFRAITPPGRPRRFDARFFLADAEALSTDPDDFAAASDELSHLRWIPLAEVRRANLAFITEVVLAELEAHIRTDGAPKAVPFFKNDAPALRITSIS